MYEFKVIKTFYDIPFTIQQAILLRSIVIEARAKLFLNCDYKYFK